MKVLFILNDPPYGTERCYNAVRLANAKELTTKVTVFLMADARLMRPQGSENARRLLQSRTHAEALRNGSTQNPAVRNLHGRADAPSPTSAMVGGADR